MEFIHFVGIDVSKNKLDLAVFKGREFLFHKEIENTISAIENFITKDLQNLTDFTISSVLFCMEHTGIYNNPLLSVFEIKKLNVCLESARHIKYSLGNIRGKNDKIDSIRIAEYACKNQYDLKIWKPKREILVRLKHLTVLRDRLINTKKVLSTPISQLQGFVPKKYYTEQVKLCQRTLNSIEADIAKVENRIHEIIQKDELLSHLFGIITSVQGVGKETAVQMILTTNEFKDIKNPKKFACYSGIAPFTKESGMFKGKGRVSHMANKKMKTVLHMAALSSITCNSDLKDYYERKVAEGKNKLSVVNAVRNKLIHRVFTCVNENRKYEKNYNRLVA